MMCDDIIVLMENGMCTCVFLCLLETSKVLVLGSKYEFSETASLVLSSFPVFLLAIFCCIYYDICISVTSLFSNT